MSLRSKVLNHMLTVT